MEQWLGWAAFWALGAAWAVRDLLERRRVNRLVRDVLEAVEGEAHYANGPAPAVETLEGAALEVSDWPVFLDCIKRPRPGSITGLDYGYRCRCGFGWNEAAEGPGICSVCGGRGHLVGWLISPGSRPLSVQPLTER